MSSGRRSLRRSSDWKKQWQPAGLLKQRRQRPSRRLRPRPPPQLRQQPRKRRRQRRRQPARQQRLKPQAMLLLLRSRLPWQLRSWLACGSSLRSRRQQCRRRRPLGIGLRQILLLRQPRLRSFGVSCKAAVRVLRRQPRRLKSALPSWLPKWRL